MGEESASVNFVAEDESESEEDEDEEWWVGTVGAVEVCEGEEEALEEIDESEPEGEIQFITSIFTRKDDSGLEDEFEYPLDVHASGEPLGGGARSPPSQVLKRMRRRFSTLCKYWALGPGG
jgi:hypothetical protein